MMPCVADTQAVSHLGVDKSMKRQSLYPLLAFTFLLIVGLLCTGNNTGSPSRFTDSTDSKVPPRCADSDFGHSDLLFPCRLGGSSGERLCETIPPVFAGVRLLFDKNANHSLLFLRGNIRYLYGNVRPHLFLCRLQN